MVGVVGGVARTRKKPLAIRPTAWLCLVQSRDPEGWDWAEQSALTCRTLQEALQLATADRMLQFTNRLGFDLPHPFSGNLEDPANFFQRVRIAIAQSVPESNDLAFTIGEGFE